MKKVLIAAALLIACGWIVISWAVEANSGGPLLPTLICTSAETSVSYSSTNRNMMPTGYTLWSNDGTTFRFIRRFADGLRDTVGIVVPANTSMLVPAPTSIYEGSAYTHTIFIGGHTDTVYAAPWFK